MEKQIEILKLLKKIKKGDETNETHLELFNILYTIGYKIANKALRNKFKSVPIEAEDFMSTIYLVYIDTIRWFKTTNEKLEKFIYYFVYKVKQTIINKCILYTRDGHVILNYSKHEEKIYSNVSNDDVNYEQKMMDKIFLDDFINQLVGIQKEIVLLKMQGYSTIEISKILNCPYNTISYEWKKAIQKPLE